MGVVETECEITDNCSWSPIATGKYSRLSDETPGTIMILSLPRWRTSPNRYGTWASLLVVERPTQNEQFSLIQSDCGAIGSWKPRRYPGSDTQMHLLSRPFMNSRDPKNGLMKDGFTSN